jgi:putative phosphoribosyl transferase
MKSEPAKIPAAGAVIEGVLDVPAESRGIVLFAHGSGSGRASPRNNFVAEALRRRQLGTLLVDLLTKEEDIVHAARFDIELLTQRLSAALSWLRADAATHVPVGLFGASTGAAAALRLSNSAPDVGAVVSRGGRPDFAGLAALHAVRAPTLLIVGGADTVVIDLNRAALAELRCEKRLDIVPGATHLFEEPGALERVASLAGDWFVEHLRAATATGAPAVVSIPHA